MTSLPSTDHSETDDVRWAAVDPRTWEARCGSVVIGTVVFGSRYVVRLRDGDMTGFHTSLESAKAQLEAWVRWQSGPPGEL
ncbi:hypothetical protein BJK06_17275 [Curtobacterium sp. BH-2-1-1]|uniref:hypothetical protein n=1 Tax=unclassified Curtobacterium TaxID=257496 RepID=UPI00089E0A34|nr:MULTISPECIES: hypothetical protein [unclassified Curtobacterium]AOX67231.1 hypothetical protein BJK06_17275 [Curtobacterium sp. BH-2-1-1]SFF79444.1 hypothetical protein SAMN05216329_2821 [Curtobacterium sp. YR515]